MSQHKLVHFFIPHKKNNYRAHFLKPITFHTISFFLIALQAVFMLVGKSHPQVLGVEYSITPTDIISQTNDQRGKNGLPALKQNGQLAVAAQLKGQDMIAKGYWAHVSPDGTEPWFFIRKAGYSYSRAGENLARDFRDSISVVNAWMNSPGHRANVLNPYYKDIGVSVVSGPFNGYDAVIVVQMFGDPLNSGVAGALTQPENVGAQAPKPAVGKEVALKLNNSIATSSGVTSSTGSASLVKPELAQSNEVIDQTQNSPAIDPVRVTKIVLLVVGTFFIVLLGIDAYVIARKRIKRDRHGHSLFHAIFLAIIMVTLLVVQTGLII